MIQNLPENYNKVLLKELLAKYPGVEDMSMNANDNSATVRFRDN